VLGLAPIANKTISTSSDPFVGRSRSLEMIKAAVEAALGGARRLGSHIR
jgi:hypothetical protein